MASSDDDVRYSRRLRRVMLLALGSAAAVALLPATGSATAQPLVVPGIGTFETPLDTVPDSFTAPKIDNIPAHEIPQVKMGEIPAIVPARAELTPVRVEPIDLTIPPLPFALPQLPGVQPPAPASVPEQTRGEAAIAAARSKLGATYVPGATGPHSFDCSGLVQWSYRHAGVDLPRTSHQQLAAGTPVSRNDLRPGDLVSFYGGGHSALYSGGGKVIHAATSGEGVVESDMAAMPFAGARRY
ncbi:C40 family peptidase [Nocardia cyriacigeorgica]|nr:C40 family peptidase [Nocardia cyriacigeorgica]MBF6476939.1 C40 family peptidase [Nocardia cyriacigeorgica]MBF6550201.1 C40 family peptidase [Nocardia cyriacigeorgica]